MLNILVVDDSLIIRKKMKTIIEKLGHKVVSDAQNGREGIDEYNANKPDLVTMDITMPDMDGISAVKEIMKSDANAKIIMVTSHGQEDMVIKSIQAGAVGYMLKPISEDKFAQAVAEVFPEYAVDDENDEFLDFDE